MKTQKKQLPTGDYDRVVRTTCPSCGAGCGLKVFLKDGKAIEIYGDEENQLNKGSICPRGLSALFHLYHNERLRRPLLRNKLSEEFRPVTWAEALDHVTEKLRVIGETYSLESVYLHLTPHCGFGNVLLGRRFGELFGTPNVDEDLSPESSPAGVVLRHMLGIRANGCAMSSRYEWSSSQAMLLVGVDPASTDPVAFGPILDAKDRGTKIIVLDSRNSFSMGKADISLKSRVGTEQAVLLSLAHVILEEKLYNDEFIKHWVEGLEEFAALCREYPPAEAERISGVKREEIMRAARTFADGFPSMVIGHSRVSSRFSGGGLVYCMVSLAGITGSIGCSGGGITLLHNFPPLGAGGEDEKKPSFKKPGLVHVGSGSAIWRAIAEGKPYQIRGIIWDTNALEYAPQGARIQESLKKVDLIVHLGQYPNLTYHHSHVVFPITSFLETEGLVFASVGREIQWANRAVEPRGECRPADDFWGGLLQRFGFTSSFSFIDGQGRVNIRDITRYFLALNPLTSGITPELLDPETNPPGGIQWPVADGGEVDFPSQRAAVRGEVRLFRPGSFFPGSRKRFPTPSGKVKISPREITAEKGFQAFARYQDLPGIGSRTEGLVKGDRFILITGELVDYLPASGFLALPQKPEKCLFIQIHPRRAKELNIHQGEMIVVENERGKIKGPAWITERVDEETLFCPMGVKAFDPLNRFESPSGLMDFVPEDDHCGRRYLEAARVKVRKVL
ncbi:MAG: molybdopterin-dependent oxidoreductase [Deltaproteobacteria bacterium]|nr:molybdopterin-dependent oxidoreductase [Deltaproteobacteria bacterium]